MNNFFKVLVMLKLYFFRALEFLKGRKNTPKDVEAETGDLLVSGIGETEILLPSLPRVIEVNFKDTQIHIPCDHHHDKLEYEICKHHHTYKLIIKWHVGNFREVVWIAFF